MKVKYDITDLRTRLISCFPAILPAHTSEGHFYQREDTGRVAASVTTKLGFVSKSYLHKWYAKRTAEYVREHLNRLINGDLAVLDEAQHAGERSRDDSAGIGTTAHGAIDAYNTEWIKSGNRPNSAVTFLYEGSKGEEIAACRSFDKFISEHEVVPIASEIAVWYGNGKDYYAGTVDFLFLWLEVYKERYGDKGCTHDYAPQKKVLWCTKCNREVKAYLTLADWKSSNTIRGKDDYSQQDTAYAKAIEVAAGIKFDRLVVIRLDKNRASYEICEVTDRKVAWREFLTISRAYDERAKRGNVSLLEPIEKKNVIQI